MGTTDQKCHIFFLRSIAVYRQTYTTQNLLRITFSFNDLMLKTNQSTEKRFFFIKIG